MCAIWFEFIIITNSIIERGISFAEGGGKGNSKLNFCCGLLIRESREGAFWMG